MELTKDEMLINAVEACNDTYKKRVCLLKPQL